MNTKIAFLAGFRVPRNRTHGADAIIEYFKSAEIRHVVLIEPTTSGEMARADNRNWLSGNEMARYIYDRFRGQITIQGTALESGPPDFGSRVRYTNGSFEVVTGWTSMAADKDASKFAGAGAIAMARAEGNSVVFGGTHTPGVIHEALSVDGRRRELWGFEIGTMRSLSGRDRPLLSFGVLDWNGRKALPSLVAVDLTCARVTEG